MCKILDVSYWVKFQVKVPYLLLTSTQTQNKIVQMSEYNDSSILWKKEFDMRRIYFLWVLIKDHMQCCAFYICISFDMYTKVALQHFLSDAGQATSMCRAAKCENKGP